MQKHLGDNREKPESHQSTFPGEMGLNGPPPLWSDLVSPSSTHRALPPGALRGGCEPHLALFMGRRPCGEVPEC